MESCFVRWISGTCVIQLGACFLVAVAQTPCVAQPEGIGPFVRSVPVEVVVDPAGRAGLVTTPIEPAPLDHVRGLLPDEVPVYSTDGVGRRTLGVTWRNDLARIAWQPSRRYPGFVVLMPDGSWAIDEVTWMLMDGAIGPRGVVAIPGSEDARLMVAAADGSERLMPVHENHRLTPTIIWSYDPTDAPPGAQNVSRAIERAVRAWRELLRNEDFTCEFHFRWEPGLLPGVLASSALTERDDRSWNNVRAVMQGFYDDNDLDPTETAVYENLPMGSSISYTRDQGSDSTSGICLPVPLLTKWFNAGGDQLVIEFNPDMNDVLWDLDGTNGITAGHYDFEGTLIHEMGHHFGFVSELENLTDNFFYDFLSNWDVFRFDDSAGPSISASEMLSATRQLAFGEAALGATALNSSTRVYDLADGANGQASHWLDAATGGPNYIGIMDARASIGVSDVVNGSFFQPADIRAFDVMGYNINEDSITPAPGTAALIFPQHNAVVPAASLTLDWGASSNTATYDVLVFEVTPSPMRPSTEVWRAIDLSDTEATIPDGILQPGRAYEWYVVSFNWRGYVFSETFAFTTEGGCPADFNGDGAVDTRDVIDFLNAWNAGDPSADFNGDGVVDTRDTIDFLNAWNQGCP